MRPFLLALGPFCAPPFPPACQLMLLYFFAGPYPFQALAEVRKRFPQGAAVLDPEPMEIEVRIPMHRLLCCVDPR